ncbi:MAG: MFS transporter [Bacteroidetes bacterium]|nr:MFS transporter [Bacteroidota bacterium]
MKKKTIPVFFAFLCMGFGDAVGPFVGLAKETFNLSQTMAQLIPFAGFIMFGVLSIPMGIFQDKIGKKNTLSIGLFIALIAMLIPLVFTLGSYTTFLVTILLLGSGAAVLQVSGNPIMRDVSPEGKYSSNLSFAQFVKAIGSLTGPIIPVLAVSLWASDWQLIFPIYAFALAITLVLVRIMNIEEKVNEAASATIKSSVQLLKNKYVLSMVLGIFLYVGAEVCLSSGIPLYMQDQYDIDISSLGILGSGLFFLALTIGRFFGGLLLKSIQPVKFLVWTSILSLAGILLFISGIQIVSLVAIFIVGLGFANIFPLIFSIAVDKMPERSNELSGLMVTAIIGGAILPFIMGAMADMVGTVFGFVVPLIAIAYIYLLSTNEKKKLADKRSVK